MQSLPRTRSGDDGPVIITNPGKPQQVLLSYEEYQRLTGQQPGIVAALSMPGLSDIDFEPPPATITLRTPELD